MASYYYSSRFLSRMGGLTGMVMSRLSSYYELTPAYTVGNYEVGMCTYKPEFVASDGGIPLNYDMACVYVAVVGKEDKVIQHVWKCKFSTRQPREITGKFLKIRKFVSKHFGSQEWPLENILEWGRIQANYLAGINENQSRRIEEVVAEMKLKQAALQRVLEEG